MPGENSGNNSGLPSYTDIGTSTTPSSTPVPGTPEWYQSELGGNYNQPMLIGISTSQDTTGGQYGEHSGPGSHGYVMRGQGLETTTTNDYQKSQDIYKQYIALASKHPDAFMQLQGMLYDAGFYGSSSRASVHWGMVTDQTTSALKAAINAYLTAANATGQPMTWTEFLEKQAQQGQINQAEGGVGAAGGSGSGTGSQPPPLSISLEDPAALSNYLQRFAVEELGQAVDPKQIQDFVSKFHGEQTTAQTDQYNAAVNGQDSSIVTPNAQAEAERYAQSANPDEFVQHNIGGYANTLFNMFLGSNSSRPNISVNPTV